LGTGRRAEARRLHNQRQRPAQLVELDVEIQKVEGAQVEVKG
jgi:hypothetical protein